MSTLMDGINSAYLLTAQINALKAQKQAGMDNPQAIKYALEQNFNKMLNDLVSSTSDEDEKKKSAFE